VIGDVLPLAVVVTVSPINIVAAILLLFSRRPVLHASCYLAGFVMGVASVLGALTAVAGAASLSTDSQRSRGASGLLLGLGIVLLIVAARKFRSRPDPGETSPMPGWMDGIAGFGPGKSFVIGLTVGAANPKNIAVGLASAVTIASAAITAGQAVGVVAVYTVVASLGVATPIIAMLVLGDRSEEVLAGWQSWLNRNNTAMMAVLYLIFGVILVGKGIVGI
jgi:cytochrome c biogenesis protein CcdA